MVVVGVVPVVVGFWSLVVFVSGCSLLVVVCFVVLVCYQRCFLLIDWLVGLLLVVLLVVGWLVGWLVRSFVRSFVRSLSVCAGAVVGSPAAVAVCIAVVVVCPCRCWLLLVVGLLCWSVGGSV